MTETASQFIRIPLPAGRFLSARLWRPADGEPVPAILEFRPYRGYDQFRALEDQYLPVWATAGYAVLAVDSAGSGQSTGLLADEYLPTEIDDAVAAINWCAAQPWCDGQVGLSGMSWSAFTALRVSARRPAALKALALGGVSEDGWRTDIHNLGGVPYAAEVDWAGVMLQLNALPPDPAEFGAGWKDAWLARLDANRPWIETWLAHPARDAYWAGKAFELDGLDGPDLPLLLYAGWADKYATSVLRIAAAWRGPVRTIIGPWEHTIPDLARRRPRIDYLGEALCWWDHWLKGIEAGAMREPALRAWIGEPDRDGRTATGRWVDAPWPPKPARGLTLAALDTARLGAERNAVQHCVWRLVPAPRTPESLNVDRYEDAPGPFDVEAAQVAGAAILFSDPWTEDIEILGQPILTLQAVIGAPGGRIVARLIDIDAEGRAVRMSVGALNLLLHGDPAQPRPTTPGETIDVAVEFQATAWRLKRGHRLALAISADGWPTLWPDPAGTPIGIERLVLRLPLPGPDAVPVAFAEPRRPPRADTGPPRWLDPAAHGLEPTGLANAAAHDSGGGYHLAATETDYFSASRFEVALLEDGRQAVATKTARTLFQRPDWRIQVDTRLVVTSTPDAFDIRWLVRARHDGSLVFEREDEVRVPRRDA